jgi:hypothetical protein
MPDPAVVLLGPAHVAAALAARIDGRVVTPAEAGQLAGADAVVGIAAEPWPAFVATHEAVRDAVAGSPYYAVQAWHQHPVWIEAMVAAVAAGRSEAGEDAHVLFTAPGPTAEPEPHEVVFLREVAEMVTGRLSLASRSIAWVGGESGPSTATALAALAEAHGRTTVLRASLDPLGRPDGVHAEASSVGVDLHEARVHPDDLIEVLAAVVATVSEHEGLRP